MDVPERQAIDAGPADELPLEVDAAPLHTVEAAFEVKQPQDPPADLVELVPTADPGIFELLQSTLASYRILVMRGPAGVAVTAIIAVVGSLAAHLLFLGLLVGLAFATLHYVPTTGTDQWAGQGEPGGSGGILLEGLPGFDPGPTLQQSALPQSESPKSNALPIRPVEPDAASRLLAGRNEPIGLPSAGDALGAPRVKAPTINRPEPATQPVITTPNVAAVLPPTPVVNEKIESNVVAHAGGKAGRGSAGTGNRGLGAGEASDEPEFDFDLLKPGKGGSGNGRGKGVGDGNDRGPSAANSRARPIHTPLPPMPVNLSVKKIPNDKVVFEVTVNLDGKLTNVKVRESSGDPEIDEFFRLAVSRWRYLPEYVAGKPVVVTADPAITFGKPGE